jgi:hypothetical protein
LRELRRNVLQRRLIDGIQLTHAKDTHACHVCSLLKEKIQLHNRANLLFFPSESKKMKETRRICEARSIAQLVKQNTKQNTYSSVLSILSIRILSLISRYINNVSRQALRLCLLPSFEILLITIIPASRP